MNQQYKQYLKNSILIKQTRQELIKYYKITNIEARLYINFLIKNNLYKTIQKYHNGTLSKELYEHWLNGVILDFDNINRDTFINDDFIVNSEKYNFLILPDLHTPFDSNYVLQYIAKYIKKLNIDVIVCTGDEADFHASSYHETRTEAIGVDDELYYAKRNLRIWTDTLLPLVNYKYIYCCNSNHGAIPSRKLQTAGISNNFLKSKQDVYDLPEWIFLDKFVTNKFGVSHGTGGKNLLKRVLVNNKSWIIGHYHTSAYLNFITEDKWAVQLSCAVNKNSYAMTYSKDNVEINPIIHTFLLILKGKPFLISIP